MLTEHSCYTKWGNIRTRHFMLDRWMFLGLVVRGEESCVWSNSCRSAPFILCQFRVFFHWEITTFAVEWPSEPNLKKELHGQGSHQPGNFVSWVWRRPSEKVEHLSGGPVTARGRLAAISATDVNCGSANSSRNCLIGISIHFSHQFKFNHFKISHTKNLINSI